MYPSVDRRTGLMLRTPDSDRPQASFVAFACVLNINQGDYSADKQFAFNSNGSCDDELFVVVSYECKTSDV